MANARHISENVRSLVRPGFCLVALIMMTVATTAPCQIATAVNRVTNSTEAGNKAALPLRTVGNSSANRSEEIRSVPKPPVASHWTINWDAMAVWSSILVTVLLGALAAIYPIDFYLSQVWKSRRRTIFETLDVNAKKIYLDVYHPSEAANQIGNVETAFNDVYDRWFGRDRLLKPAWFASIFIIVYLFLSAIVAAKALFPHSPSANAIPLKIDLIAVASMSGAYVLVTMDTIARVTRRDLLPEDLYLTTLRLAACVPLGYAFASLVSGSPTAPFIALALTAFPLQQLATFLQQIGSQKLGVTLPSGAVVNNDVPSKLAGVEQTVCERFAAIGVNTISQIAYSDPVLLTMRTSLNFVFILDVVSQALAWIYLEQKLATIRPMGLRGAFEMKSLYDEYKRKKPAAIALMVQLPTALGMTTEQTLNMFSEVVSDPRVSFLHEAF